MIHNRTALCNQMRAILVESGIIAPKGVSSLLDVARAQLAQEDVLTPMCRISIADLLAEFLELEERIGVNERRINEHAKKANSVGDYKACQELAPLRRPQLRRRWSIPQNSKMAETLPRGSALFRDTRQLSVRRRSLRLGAESSRTRAFRLAHICRLRDAQSQALFYGKPAPFRSVARPSKSSKYLPVRSVPEDLAVRNRAAEERLASVQYDLAKLNHQGVGSNTLDSGGSSPAFFVVCRSQGFD